MHEKCVVPTEPAAIPVLIISFHGTGIQMPPHLKAHRNPLSHRNELQQKEITPVSSSNSMKIRASNSARKSTFVFFLKKRTKMKQGSFHTCRFISPSSPLTCIFTRAFVKLIQTRFVIKEESRTTVAQSCPIQPL